MTQENMEDISILIQNRSYLNFNDNNMSVEADPRILAISYMMYKVGKLLAFLLFHAIQTLKQP